MSLFLCASTNCVVQSFYNFWKCVQVFFQWKVWCSANSVYTPQLAKLICATQHSNCTAFQESLNSQSRQDCCHVCKNLPFTITVIWQFCCPTFTEQRLNVTWQLRLHCCWRVTRSRCFRSTKKMPITSNCLTAQWEVHVWCSQLLLKHLYCQLVTLKLSSVTLLLCDPAVVFFFFSPKWNMLDLD